MRMLVCLIGCFPNVVFIVERSSMRRHVQFPKAQKGREHGIYMLASRHGTRLGLQAR